MKLISLLSASAVLSLGIFAFALLSGRAAAGLYAIATIALLLLIAARDYAPRRPLWQPCGPGDRGLAKARRGATESMRLAA